MTLRSQVQPRGGSSGPPALPPPQQPSSKRSRAPHPQPVPGSCSTKDTVLIPLPVPGRPRHVEQDQPCTPGLAEDDPVELHSRVHSPDVGLVPGGEGHPGLRQAPGKHSGSQVGLAPHKDPTGRSLHARPGSPDRMSPTHEKALISEHSVGGITETPSFCVYVRPPSDTVLLGVKGSPLCTPARRPGHETWS